METGRADAGTLRKGLPDIRTGLFISCATARDSGREHALRDPRSALKTGPEGRYNAMVRADNHSVGALHFG